MSSFLCVHNLSAFYSTRPYGIFGKKNIHHVLSNINLEIEQGEIFGLVGESGSGKSTLAKCILGLQEYQGEVILNGRKRGKKPSYSERRQNAFEVQPVFQDASSSLNPARTIGWILEEPLRGNSLFRVNGRRLYPKERQAKVDAALDMVGLNSSYKNRKPDELSSGQKQRVAIGAAVIFNPGLIIADEPVSSLDVSVGAQILNLFRELNRKLNLTMIFISHNTGQVEYLCDRIALMKDGVIS